MRTKQKILVKVDFEEQKTEEEYPSVKDEPPQEEVIVLDDDEDSVDSKDDIVFLPPHPIKEPSKSKIVSSNSFQKKEVRIPKEQCSPLRKCSLNEERLKAVSEKMRQHIAEIDPEKKDQQKKKAKARGKEILNDWSDFPYQKKAEVKTENSATSTSICVPVQKKKCGPPRKYFTNEERRKALAEKRRQRRAAMDPEKKAEILRKNREYKKRVKASMATVEESEKEEMLETRREYERQRLEGMNSDRREHYLRKCREYQRNHRKRIMADKEKAEEYRKRKNIQQFIAKQGRLASMTEEEKEELRSKERESQKKSKLNMTEERKKQRRNYYYFKYQAKLAEMTKEEREEWTRKNTEYARNWRASLTGEKKERYKEYLKRKMKEYQQTEKFKEKLQQRHERLLEYYRRRTAAETPEERLKRLRKYKVNQAVRKLKKELENEGVPQDEIDAKAKELKERMWAEPLPPPEKISNYKPRLKRGGGCNGEPDSSQFVFKRLTRRRQNQSEPPPPSTKESSHSDAPIFEQMEELHDDSDSRLHDYHEGENFDDDYQDDTRDTAPVEEENETSTTSISELPSPSMNQKSSPLFECPHCIFSFPEKEDLTAHVISEHPKKCWKCPVCKQILLSPAELKEHFQSQHAPKVPAKTATTKSFDLPNKVGATATTQPKSANSGLFTCMKCDPLSPESENRFATQNDLNEHVKSQHPESHWPCRNCGLLKYSERTLITHEKVCGSGSGSAIKMLKSS